MTKRILRLAMMILLPGHMLAAETARLAIIADQSALVSAADLLTVALSTNQQVHLVERAEMDKVIGEQAVSAGGKDFLKLGQVLGADGVVLIGMAGEGTNQFLSLRLIAVKPGVVLRQFSSPWPPENLVVLSTELAQRLTPLLPKLKVLKKDAVPISILNLRGAVRTTESQLLEQELTTLLHNRLMQQPEVFVLERRRMELLTEEKDLNGETAAFWSGGYLIEGLINKERYDKDEVTITGKLVPPDKQDATLIELTGQRTNLPALIDELARRVLAAAKNGVVLKEWNPAEEAAQYWDEAQWAAKWRMWREAQAAGEASWALGRQTKEVAELRVRAWRETGLDQAACTFERLTIRVNYSAPPDEHRFGDMRRAADLFEAGWKQFVASETRLDPKWSDLGIALAADLSAWLRHFYFMPEARVGQEEQIKQAQQQAERICGLLMGHADYPKFAGKPALSLTRALWGSLWVNAPEQGLKLYRELLDSGEWPLVRKRFLNAGCFEQEGDTRRLNGWPEGFYDPASPLLIGWKWEDRKRWPQVWGRFVNEWCASTNPLVAVEGRYLRCSFAWTGDDYERELRELLQYVWEQREVLAAAKLTDGLLMDLQTLAGRRKWIQSEPWPQFEKKFLDLLQAGAENEKRRQFISEARTYLTTRNDFDFGSVARWQREKFSEAEAKELLPLVQDYKKRLTELPPRTLRGGWFNSVTRLEAALLSIATGTPPTNRTAAATSVAQSAGPPANQARTFDPPVSAGPRLRPGGLSPFGERSAVQPVIDPQTIGATNYFRGVRFWRPDRSQFRSQQQDAFNIPDVIFREGRIWAEVLFRDVDEFTYGWTSRAVICAIAPDTLVTEQIHIETDQGVVPSAFWTHNGERHFEVFQNAVYFNVGGKLRRYSLQRRQWEAVPVPVEGSVKLELVQDRLYLRTADSILVLNPAGDGAEILASSRRRPAQNALDQIEQLGSATIFSRSTGGVCVTVDNRTWTYSEAKKDWELMPPSPQKNELLPLPMPGREEVTATESNQTWSFVGELAVQSANGQPMLKNINGRQGMLSGFDPARKSTVRIPLRLEVPRDLVSGSVLNGLANSGSLGKTLFRATPPGLILAHHRLPGFWLLPRQELERQTSEWNKTHPSISDPVQTNANSDASRP